MRPVASTATWHVPVPAELRAESGCNFPSNRRKLATSPVGLPSNASSSDAEYTNSCPGESASQSTLGTFAATPAGVSTAVSGSQS